MNELVERLSSRSNIAAERAKSALELKAQIDRNFVLIKFTETKGGTELGFELDSAFCDLDGADFESGIGKVILSGELTLNYEKVRCHTEIDLSTLKGTGYLEPISQ